MSANPPFQAIVFDLDGTLVDTLPDIHEALNRSLSETGLSEIGEAACRNMIGGGAHNLIEQAFTLIGESSDNPRIDPVFARFIALYEAEPAVRSHPFPGAVAALEALREQGIALGICSNKPHTLTEMVLKDLKLEHFFGDAVIGGDALAIRKPDAGHLLEVIKRLGHPPSAALMVGDSATDVGAARNAGIPIIAVDFGYTNTPAAELGADALISHFDSLLDTISAL